MSHRDSIDFIPYLTSVSPDSFASAGAATLTLVGNGLTSTTAVDISTLGTVGSVVSLTQNSATQQTLVVNITVAAIPATWAERAVSEGYR